MGSKLKFYVDFYPIDSNNEEHRLENLEPEPEPGEPRLEILEAWAWAYFENHEPEPEPEPKFRAPSLSLEPKLK